MTRLDDLYFRRKFSLTMHKNKRLMLGEMSFYKDFAHDRRGDLYPLLERSGECSEELREGIYRHRAESGRTVRLLGEYFPYATYEIRPKEFDGQIGFAFLGGGKSGEILFGQEWGKLVIFFGNRRYETGMDLARGDALLVTCRVQNFDIYVRRGDYAEYITTLTDESFADANRYEIFRTVKVGLSVTGNATLSSVSFYMDCGISQADIRPIRYENGEVMTEGGKVYLTVTVRMQEECYQGVFSWVPGTAELEMTGAIFFDVGDGIWGNDVASSVCYCRGEGVWYLWVCSFSHGHILGRARMEGDVRFGVNAVDIRLMEPMRAGDPDTAFLGKWGDEDPDFLYIESEKKWIMTVCRPVGTSEAAKYRYFLFESQEPLDGYRYVANALSGEETGGSIVPTEGGYSLVCGNGFDRRAEYRIYSLPDMSRFSLLRCDYDDGGFRGWGTVIPIKAGTRTKYYWLTFDRHLGSGYNWSYGNLYCYEADRL